MADSGYNGWTNYETWVVALWINNDQGWQESAQDAVRGCDRYDAAQAVRENVESVVYDPDMGGYDVGQASLVADLLTSALGSVDWYEIADSILVDLVEQDA